LNKTASGIVLILVLVGLLSLVFNIEPVRATGTIYIRADGSIDPPTAPIQRNGTLYTFTDDIYDQIIVEKDNIVIDGAAHVLQGTGASWTTGIDLTRRSNVTVERVDIRGFNYGICLSNSLDNRILDNNITSAVEGVSVNYASGNLVSGNSIADNSWFGVSLVYSSYNCLQENIITNSSNGIFIGWSSDHNNVSRNIIYNIYGDARSAGLFIGSGYNIISANNLTNNTEGVLFFQSGYNEFKGNIVEGNFYAVDAMEDSTDIICHNNFFSNTNKAYYHDCVWNDSYPSGGNFWDDYVGNDIYRGPFQNESGSDGIGDTPYAISTYPEAPLDHYPLTSPWPSGPLSHEIKVTLESPEIWPLNSPTLLNATVINSEINSESNVGLSLFVNDTSVNSATIPSLGPSESLTITYLWTPTTQGAYNITAYASPLTGEVYIVNNQVTRFSTVRNASIFRVPFDYPTIQEAVNAIPAYSMPQDTIHVAAEIYHENVILNKTLSIVGENRDTTIMDGNGTGNAITITGKNIFLANFTIQNTGGSGVYLQSASKCHITQNNITGNEQGITLEYSFDNIISKNSLQANSAIGIFADYSYNNTISGNTVVANGDNGIALWYSSSANTVFENTIKANPTGVYDVGGGNKYYHNNFLNNTEQVFAIYANTWDNGYPSAETTGATT
jgi:parallel beta-helix repeat protein